MPIDYYSNIRPPLGGIGYPDGSASWNVWAPRAESLELVLIDTNGKQSTRPLERQERGYYTHIEPNIKEGQRYLYRLNGRKELPDPASRWQPDGVHQPSAVLRLDRFEWNEGEWQGRPLQDYIIYELHVGTFTSEGTFDAVIARLPALRELGITAIEIMPVAQFSGERGWGYDGVHPFAVQNSYGGPHGLQRLINACHRVGLAVILDVVYNHLGPEGNYLGEFGDYFTDRYSTPWGSAINFDSSGSDGCREFVLENVRQWIRDYRVDALRLDAVHAIYDFSAIHILREIAEVARTEAAKRGRPAWVIAESDLNDVRLIDPVERNGFGLDAHWSDDFHHSVHSLLTGERDGYYVDFGQPEQLVKVLNTGFVYDGIYSPFRNRRHGAPAGEHPGYRFVVSIQNHDQVGNRATGDRFGTLLTPGKQRLAAGLMLLSPYLPMIYMGEEYGEKRPFPFFCSFSDEELVEAVREGRRAEFADFAWQGEVPDPQAERTFESGVLSWDWHADSVAAGTRRLYGDLIEMRQRWPLFRDFVHRSAELVQGAEAVLKFVRGAGGLTDSDKQLVAYFNLSDSEQSLPAPPAGSVRLLSSEDPRYAGTRDEEARDDILLPNEFQVFGPEMWGRP